MSEDKLAIIGGGIAGVGLALIAAEKGFQVTLIEKNKLFSGASSNSLRIIHGGLRYLKNFNLPRAIISARAKKELFERFGDYIKPLSCYMPIQDRFSMTGVFACRLGAFGYRLIERAVGNKRATPQVFDNVPEICGLFPELPFVPKGFLFWQDGVINDLQAFHDALRKILIGYGVSIIEDHKALSIESNETAPIKIIISDEKQTYSEIISDFLIDTTISKNLLLNGESSSDFNLARAFNFIFRCRYCFGGALAIASPSGRQFFFVPRGNLLAIGTGYLPYKGELTLSKSEKEIFFKEINESLPALKLDFDDLVSIDLGILPVRKITERGEVSFLEAPIIKSQQDRIFHLMTPKYTTFLEVARLLIGRLPT
ncbi:MAG TPA: FAD-dependent oxidoreductase [Oligoflexia bacterium]|nr:FAD-dependent oxidoreductase [Oligoflexia bacterium]HMP27248.1 FAD-dependent oxidoreductase [Oligoflexia bacterium]